MTSAWQRWAEGVADIFISRRLLRGLPTCFSTWCHSVRQQSALHARAAAMQTDASRQLLVFTFGTLRCILALRRLQRFDSEKCLRELRAWLRESALVVPDVCESRDRAGYRPRLSQSTSRSSSALVLAGFQIMSTSAQAFHGSFEDLPEEVWLGAAASFLWSHFLCPAGALPSPWRQS